jgi:hypothetical protein
LSSSTLDSTDFASSCELISTNTASCCIDVTVDHACFGRVRSRKSDVRLTRYYLLHGSQKFPHEHRVVLHRRSLRPRMLRQSSLSQQRRPPDSVLRSSREPAILPLPAASGPLHNSVRSRIDGAWCRGFLGSTGSEFRCRQSIRHSAGSRTAPGVGAD